MRSSASDACRVVPVPEMIGVPGGTVRLGVPECPREFAMPHSWVANREVFVPGFQIGKFAVTRLQYGAFLEATGREQPLDWNDPVLGDPQQPVCGTSWDDARAYCRWLSQSSGRAFRLPSADEWEKAARGGLVGKLFPWGDGDPAERCCYGQPEQSSPAPVGSFAPNGYGLYDMAGNVWEWLNARYCEIGPDPPKNFSCILTAYDAILDGRPVAVLHAGQLQDPAHGRRPHALTLTGRSPHENRVLVGGSFMTPSADILRVAYRHEDPPDLRMRCLGFRVAL